MNQALTQRDVDLRIERERTIDAPIDVVFDVLLEHVGPSMAQLDGASLKLKLEAKPGGRWYRDLGDGNGHLWGFVQAIKRPGLLELSGPMFLSLPTVHNVQYRLESVGKSTRLRLVHTAVGPIPNEAREGMPKGWEHQFELIGKAATKSK